VNIEPQNTRPQNFEGFNFIIRYSLFDILLFKKIREKIQNMNKKLKDVVLCNGQYFVNFFRQFLDVKRLLYKPLAPPVHDR
jgi:hypothetical protein